MKKLLLIIAVLTLTASLTLTNNTPIINGAEILYLGSNSSNCKIEKTCDFKYFSPIKGENLTYQTTNFDLQENLKKYSAKLVITEKLNGIINYYAYTPYIKYCVMVGGKKVNLHFSVEEDIVNFGSPIIFGGY